MHRRNHWPPATLEPGEVLEVDLALPESRGGGEPQKEHLLVHTCFVTPYCLGFFSPLPFFLESTCRLGVTLSTQALRWEKEKIKNLSKVQTKGLDEGHRG